MATFDELTRMLNNSQTQADSPNRGGTGNPGGAYNTAPNRPGAPRPSSPSQYDNYVAQLERMYSQYYGGQNPAFGRYRPPTMGADGSDPRNWNDVGGYAYNLPNNFGPAQTSWTQLNPFGRPSPYAVATGRPGATIAGDRPQPSGYPDVRGPAYVGPRETHVGGPNDQAKQPQPIDGGTKGPMPAQAQLEVLDDWQWAPPRRYRPGVRGRY